MTRTRMFCAWGWCVEWRGMRDWRLLPERLFRWATGIYPDMRLKPFWSLRGTGLPRVRIWRMVDD